MKITIFGIGYTGLSNAILLAKKHDICLVDINNQKVEMVNNKKSPLKNDDFFRFIADDNLNIKATLDRDAAIKMASCIIIAVPTNYNPSNHGLDVSIVDSIIHDIASINPKAILVLKSTVPIGYTASVKRKYPFLDIFFIPEFLREDHALYDIHHPDRIIIGHSDNNSMALNTLLENIVTNKDVPLVITGFAEAESIKLFSNAYLAMRVTFFNEIDTFAEMNLLDSKTIIEGVCLDSRIGNHYNNPSFGYGGNCLPKDTRQLGLHFHSNPNSIFHSIQKSNEHRKQQILDRIKDTWSGCIGIFHLTSSNKPYFSNESMIDSVINDLILNDFKLIIYEPLLIDSNYLGVPVVNNLHDFIRSSDFILANRYSNELDIVKDKVYTRDVFFRD